MFNIGFLALTRCQILISSGLTPPLVDLLNGIKRGLSSNSVIADITDSKEKDQEAVITNVKAQVASMLDNPVIKEATAEGMVKVVGAFYEIETGVAHFL